MAFNIRIFEGDEDGAPVYDTLTQALPREGDTITFRWPDRDLTQYKVTRVDHLIDVKMGILGVSEDVVIVRVYTRLVSPSLHSR